MPLIHIRPLRTASVRLWLSLLCGLGWASWAPTNLPAATRLKEIAALEGVRDNQLMGYGLVVGLNGSGDRRQTVFSAQALTNVLRRMGVTVNPAAIQVRNMAAVIVTATLPPFAQPGTRIDVTAAAIGDATNLQGGMLLLTSLQGPDGEVYAAAQGPVLTGGFVAGGGANSQTLNHPTVARIPDGAIIERSPPSIAPTSQLRLQLRQADFTTAARVVEAVNRRFPVAAGEGQEAVPLAHAESSAVVSVVVPPAWAARTVEFIAALESLTVEADRMLKVVINERTGTVVLGKEVRIAPVAIMQGALSIEIRTEYDVSQPNPFSNSAGGVAQPPGLGGGAAGTIPAPPGGAQTVVTPRVDVRTNESRAQNIVLEQGATVEDLVRALQAIGATPRDIIAILQNMRASGALSAEIEVI